MALHSVIFLPDLDIVAVIELSSLKIISVTSIMSGFPTVSLKSLYTVNPSDLFVILAVTVTSACVSGTVTFPSFVIIDVSEELHVTSAFSETDLGSVISDTTEDGVDVSLSIVIASIFSSTDGTASASISCRRIFSSFTKLPDEESLFIAKRMPEIYVLPAAAAPQFVILNVSPDAPLFTAAVVFSGVSEPFLKIWNVEVSESNTMRISFIEDEPLHIGTYALEVFSLLLYMLKIPLEPFIVNRPTLRSALSL